MAILITGVTGFLGRHFLMELLLAEEKEAGSIIGLVRKSEKFSSREIMEQWMSRTALHCSKSSAELKELIRRMNHACRWVEGDVCEPLLGVSRDIWDSLEIEQIWHMAALLRFEQYKKKEIFAVNIRGTRNALELARLKKINCFHLISTLYVAGEKSGEIAEQPYDSGYPAGNPYEESKRAAEDLVLSESKRAGFAYRIYRSGIIMPHRNAVKNESRLALQNYLALFLEFRDYILERMPGYFEQNVLTILIGKKSALSCVRADDICESLLRISADSRSENRIFQITGNGVVDLALYNRLIARVAGIHVRHTQDPGRLNEVDRLFAGHMDVFSACSRNPKSFLTTESTRFGGGLDSFFTKEDILQISHLFVEQYRLQQERRLRRASRMLGAFTKKTIVLSEGDLTYFTAGEGREVIALINGYGQSFSLWKFLLLKLKKRYRVILWQPRGSVSLMGGINRYFPMERHIEDLCQILKSEKVKQCSILAWHTGPKLAVELYRRNPALVSDMIFLCPSFKGTAMGGESLSNIEEAAYEKNAEIIFKIIKAEPPAAGRVISSLKTLLVGKNIPLKKFSPGEDAANVLSMIDRSLKPVVIEPFLSSDRVIQYAMQLLEFWSYDVSGQMEEIDVPVLLVCGEHDKIISTKMAYRAGSMIKNAKVLEMRGGNHFPQYENSELLYDIIDKFHREKEDFSFHDTRVVTINS